MLLILGKLIRTRRAWRSPHAVSTSIVLYPIPDFMVLDISGYRKHSQYNDDKEQRRHYFSSIPALRVWIIWSQAEILKYPNVPEAVNIIEPISPQHRLIPESKSSSSPSVVMRWSKVSSCPSEWPYRLQWPPAGRMGTSWGPSMSCLLWNLQRKPKTNFSLEGPAISLQRHCWHLEMIKTITYKIPYIENDY